MTSKYQNIDVWRHWLIVNMFIMYKPCIALVIIYRCGARCSSVVRAFAHGAMGRRIDPPWWTH